MRNSRHPWHPALVHLPIGLWTASLVWDVVARFAAGGTWPALAYWCLLAGLVASFPAIATGFLEYLFLDDGRKLRLANWHMTVMSGAAGLFLVSLLLRLGAHAPVSTGALLCSAGGFMLLVAGGWLGAEMVYREGAGFRGSEETR